MRKSMLAAAALALLAVPLTAGAGEIGPFEPNPPDMHDLDHYKVYSWGLDVDLEPGESIVAGELKFKNIRNYNNEANDLYVHLLDWTPLGVTTVNDNQGGGDFFENFYPWNHHSLVHYEDLTTTPETLTYTFTAGDLAVLNTYLADGRIGIGMDPDCHFYNCGIELSLTTPEPASLALLAVGGLFIRRRR